MVVDLLRALVAALAVGVLPGWFWSRALCATSDTAERLTFSVALSVALVPAVALIPATMFGAGVTLTVAIVSPLIVFAVGLVAYLLVGNAKGQEAPIAPPRIPRIDPVAAALLAPAFVLAMTITLGVPPIWPIWLTILMLVVFAALVHLVSRRDADASPVPDTEEPMAPSRLVSVARRVALPVIALFVLARGYAGPVLHDWPFIRGVDHYSHAVMANRMLTEGDIYPYLIYPPGFHTMTAIVSRLSGLRPLEIFPLLAPALLLLPVLALYSLARRLWGVEYGIAAAFFAGILGGAYVYFNDAMYPNLVASQFLLVLAVAALFRLVAAPTWRHAVLLALLGSSIVLFHQVTSLYLVLLFAPVGLFALPYLLRRERPAGLALFASFALMGILSVAYAWHTYDLGGALVGMFDGEESATGDAVGMAIGTQMPNAFYTLLVEMVTQPVAWLGVLGLFLALEGLRDGTRTSSRTPRALAHLMLLLWVAIVFVGSRTDLSGFPRRFGRDLGVPLTLFAALALVVILRSVLGPRRATALSLASLLAVSTIGLVGSEVVRASVIGTGPSIQLTTTSEISAAGDWLRRHNDGGNIIVSPHANQVPSRMMLAMGGYSAVQSFEQIQAVYPRDLPPTGADPVWHTLWIMNHPGGERTGDLLRDYDIRYLVLYKDMPDRPVREHFRRFEARPDLYEPVFENEDVLIVEPTDEERAYALPGESYS